MLSRRMLSCMCICVCVCLCVYVFVCVCVCTLSCMFTGQHETHVLMWHVRLHLRKVAWSGHQGARVVRMRMHASLCSQVSLAPTCSGMSHAPQPLEVVQGPAPDVKIPTSKQTFMPLPCLRQHTSPSVVHIHQQRGVSMGIKRRTNKRIRVYTTSKPRARTHNRTHSHRA